MEAKPTITAICEDEVDEKGKVIVQGISRTTWYEWNKDEGFVNWWAECWERHMRRSMFALDKIGWLKSAKDFRYFELLQMKYANFRKKHDVTTKDQPIKTTVIIADELSKIMNDEDEEGEPRIDDKPQEQGTETEND